MTSDTTPPTGLSIQAFDFEEHAVRAITRGGEPWFVARDVCGVLGIKNSRDTLSRLDADEKDVALTDTLGGKQKTAIISEAGLYTLILRCDDAIKPGITAHRFRRWVTSEVLPALRKEGAYKMAMAVEQDARAERLDRTRCEVACGLRSINEMAEYAANRGALGGDLPMSRVRSLHSLGRLRLDALKLLWEMESTGTPARLCADGTGVVALDDDDTDPDSDEDDTETDEPGEGGDES